MTSGKSGKIELAIALLAVVISSLACGGSQRVDLATAEVVEESRSRLKELQSRNKRVSENLEHIRSLL